jgi:cyanophycinase-like exopeptidase
LRRRADGSVRKSTTLMAGKFGSRHFGTMPFLAEALRLTGKDMPLALYVGAASGDDREFGETLCRILEAAGAERVLWPRLAGTRRDHGRARDALEQVDLVFVGGGDVEAGMEVLLDADLVGDFHAAAARGVVFAGLSAGAIMLGERWIRWPSEDAGDDDAQTYECLSIAPCSIDVHGEDDHWREAQSFAAVRARELGKKVRAYGVPSGGALVVGPDGTVRARGMPVPVFVAPPNREARVETTLEAST